MSEPLVIMTPGQLEEFSKKLLQDFISNMPTAKTPLQAEIIDVEELCRRLAISVPTQIRWRKKGKLPYLMIGDQVRFNWSEVIEKLKK